MVLVFNTFTTFLRYDSSACMLTIVLHWKLCHSVLNSITFHIMNYKYLTVCICYINITTFLHIHKIILLNWRIVVLIFLSWFGLFHCYCSCSNVFPLYLQAYLLCTSGPVSEIAIVGELCSWMVATKWCWLATCRGHAC